MNLPGLGRSDPVHYFKTAGVIQISVQQHFQVHPKNKDKPIKKSIDILFKNCNIIAVKTLSIGLISYFIYIFAAQTYPDKILW
jgi:hypothetical protein